MIKEIRTLETRDIKKTIFQLKSRLLEYRFSSANGNFATTHLIKDCRRTIAQLLTILHEKKESITNKDWKIYEENAKKEIQTAKTLMNEIPDNISQQEATIKEVSKESKKVKKVLTESSEEKAPKKKSIKEMAKEAAASEPDKKENLDKETKVAKKKTAIKEPKDLK